MTTEFEKLRLEKQQKKWQIFFEELGDVAVKNNLRGVELLSCMAHLTGVLLANYSEPEESHQDVEDMIQVISHGYREGLRRKIEKEGCIH